LSVDVDKIVYPCGCSYSFFVLDNAPHVEDDGWNIDLCIPHYTELIKRYGDVIAQREKAEIKWKEQERKKMKKSLKISPTGTAYLD
jgi:hypothetical protein